MYISELVKRLLPEWSIEPIRLLLLRTNLHRHLIPHIDGDRLNDKIESILNDPRELPNFRRNGLIRVMCESATEQTGKAIQQYLHKNYAREWERLKNVKESPIGNPELGAGGFAPTTYGHLLKVAQLIRCFGTLKDFSIVEIGGGYGGLCRILLEAADIRKYEIIDLPAMLSLQRYFLRQSLPSLGEEKVIYINALDCESRFPSATWDLCISTYAISEVSRAFQEFYLQNVIYKSNNIYLLNNRIFSENMSRSEFEKHIGSRYELRRDLDLPQDISGHSLNYQLIGRRTEAH